MWRTRAARLLRSVRQPGYQRDELVLGGKSVLSAVGSWAVAAWLLPKATSAFAPFTTLLAVQGTVYRSVRHSAQYLAAVLIGTALAAAFGNSAGVHVWSLAVLLVLALAAGRLPLLGAQHTQVAVTALFAFVSGGGQDGYLLDLTAAIGLGIGFGLAVNVLLPPPARYHRAGQEVARLASSLRDVLEGMAEALSSGQLSEGQARDWRRRCDRLQTAARGARAHIRYSEEKARLNPRPRLSSLQGPAPAFHGAVDVLQRANDQIRSIARALAYAATNERHDALLDDFLTDYGRLLEVTASAVEQFGREGDPGSGDGSELRRRIDEGWDRYRGFVRRSDREPFDRFHAPDEWPVYGTLLTDVSRLLQELDQGHRGAVVPLL